MGCDFFWLCYLYFELGIMLMCFVVLEMLMFTFYFVALYVCRPKHKEVGQRWVHHQEAN